MQIDDNCFFNDPAWKPLIINKGVVFIVEFIGYAKPSWEVVRLSMISNLQ